MRGALSLALLALSLVLVALTARPYLRALRHERLLTRAFELVRAGTPQGTRAAELRRVLDALDALEEAPPIRHALRATLALGEGDAAGADRALAAYRGAGTPLARAVDRYLTGSSTTPPDPKGSSDPFALILDGWRLAHAGADAELGDLLPRIPASGRGDFHALFLRLLHGVRTRPEATDRALELLEELLEAMRRRPALRHPGFAPDAFDPILVAEGKRLVLHPGPWRGALVPLRESQLVRRADIHMALASLHQAAGRTHRSLYHAQILESGYADAVDRRGHRTALDRLLHPRPHREAVEAAATAHGVDPFLLYAVAREESHFRPDAISSAGARGLVQVVPDTARWIADQRKMARPGLKDLLDPAVNIDLGAWYIAYLRGKFRSRATREEGIQVKWVLAAYNAGLGPTSGWVTEWKERRRAEPDLAPEDVIDYPETSGYVVKVTRSRDAYRRLYGEP